MRIEAVDTRARTSIEREGVDRASKLGPILANDAPRVNNRRDPTELAFIPRSGEDGDEEVARSHPTNTVRGMKEIDVWRAANERMVVRARGRAIAAEGTIRASIELFVARFVMIEVTSGVNASVGQWVIRVLPSLVGCRLFR